MDAAEAEGVVDEARRLCIPVNSYQRVHRGEDAFAVGEFTADASVDSHATLPVVPAGTGRAARDCKRGARRRYYTPDPVGITGP